MMIIHLPVSSLKDQHLLQLTPEDAQDFFGDARECAEAWVGIWRGDASKVCNHEGAARAVLGGQLRLLVRLPAPLSSASLFLRSESAGDQRLV